MDDVPEQEGQLSLIGLTAAQARKQRARAAALRPAEQLPVARVALVGMLPHLDREFDYLVTEPLAEQAQPGTRVQVRMAGRDVDGFVVERRDASEYQGELKPLRRVVSPLPILTPSMLTTCRRVAADHAGGLGDVLRLAVPPRHAGAEQAVLESPGPEVAIPPPAVGDWANHLGGEAFLRRLAQGESPRAVWTAPPSGGDPEQLWPALLARAAATVAAAGRGVIMVLPDGRDVDRAVAALDHLGAGETTVRLTHDLGTARRYEAFVRSLTGRARIVVGTRQASYAPMPDLGLVICWDDLDSGHQEPRAPYPTTLRILRVRAEVEGCAALFGSTTRSLAAQALVESDWARQVTADRPVVRARGPRAQVAGDDFALERDPGARSRLPAVAMAAARRAVVAGFPVLVQVPRLGYLRTLACQECRAPAHCRHCHGPLRKAGPQDIPACAWCGRPAADFECPTCHGRRLRSVTVGVERTAEELGRAIPEVPVINSSGDRIRAGVPGRPAIVVATPGGEPVAEGGYGAVLILDAWLTLARPTLDAEELALWRWLTAASLARSAPQGGELVIVGAPESPVVQAVLRHDPVGSAARGLMERSELQLPPAAVFAEVSGPGTAVHDLLARFTPPPQAEVLGPVPTEDALRALVRAPAARRAELAAAVRNAVVSLSAARGALPRIQLGIVPDA